MQEQIHFWRSEKENFWQDTRCLRESGKTETTGLEKGQKPKGFRKWAARIDQLTQGLCQCGYVPPQRNFRGFSDDETGILAGASIGHA